ncbi:MAG: ABC transporter ATP-binding protein [Dehalococcoidia bacterium]|nr:ABC transporter ATP-binding protein [Dehalococcoidia bacterium]
MAIKGISVYVPQGELVCVIGANGAGKSTLIRTISGLNKPRSGMIEFEGKSIAGMPAHRIVDLGIVQVPEGRGVFPEMTILENLEMGAYLKRNKRMFKENQEKVYALFPRLKEREGQLAGTLSGGEQQMLAVGRGMMGNPKLLLLDEPSQGLSPLMVQHLSDAISVIHKQHSVTVLLVEQNARMALEIAERGYVLQTGKVVMEDSAASLLENKVVKEAYLGI